MKKTNIFRRWVILLIVVILSTSLTIVLSNYFNLQVLSPPVTTDITIIQKNDNSSPLSDNIQIETISDSIHCASVNVSYLTQYFSKDITEQIKNIFREKLIIGFEPELIEWYAETISFYDYPEELIKVLKSANVLHVKANIAEDNKWIASNIDSIERLKEAMSSDNLEDAKLIWLEVMQKNPDKDHLMLLSQYMTENIRQKNREEIIQRFDILKEFGLPIDPEILLFYPAQNLSELEQLAENYQIVNSEFALNSDIPLLETAISLGNNIAFNYLLKQKPS